MAANERLSLLIETKTVGAAEVDQLAASLNKVSDIAEKAGKKLAEKPANPYADIPSQIKQFVEAPISSATSAISGLAKGFGPLGIAAVGAVGVLGSMAAASEAATRKLADLGTEVRNVSLRTGFTTKEVGQFGFAARVVGQDIGVFESGMRKLSQGLADGGDAGKKAREALKALGVQTRDIHGDLLPTGKIFEQVAEGISKIGNSAERNAQIVKIFGRSGIELIPVLEGLTKNLARGKELNLGLDEATVKRYEHFKEQIVELDTKWASLKRRMADGIASQIVINGSTAIADLLLGVTKDTTGEYRNSYMAQRFGGIEYKPQSRKDYGPADDPARTAGVIEQGSSIVKADKKRFGQLLEGAQVEYSEAKQRAEKLRNEYFSFEGSAGKEAVETKRKEWEVAEQGAKRLETQVKLLTKAESQRLQVLEFIQNLSKVPVSVLEQEAALDRAGQGYYQIGNDSTASILTAGEQALANVRPGGPPTLARSQRERDYLGGDAFLNASTDLNPGYDRTEGTEFSGENAKVYKQMLAEARASILDEIKGLKERPGSEGLIQDAEDRLGTIARRNNGMYVSGAFIADTKSGPENDQPAATARMKGDLDEVTRKRESVLNIMKATADVNIRLMEIREAGGDERNIAETTARIRLDAAQKELEITGEIIKFEEERTRIAQDRQVKLAEIDKQQMDRGRSVAGGLFQSLFGGGAGVSSFLKSQGMGLATTVVENAAEKYVLPSILKSLPTSSSELLKGTPFFKADGSTEASALWVRMAGIGGVGTGGGTANLPAFGGVLGGLGKVLGIPGISGGYLANGGTTDGMSTPGAYSGPGEYGGGIGAEGIPEGGGMPQGTTTMGDDPGGSGGGFTGGKAMAVVGGAAQAYQGFSKGGAKNAAMGVGGVLAGAAGIAAMIPGGQLVALGLGIAAAAADVVGMLLPDPKKIREAEISKKISQGAYLAPEALNVTQDGQGHYVDTNRYGVLRGSNFSSIPNVSEPYLHYRDGQYLNVPGGVTSQFGGATAAPTIVINAIDSKSISEFMSVPTNSRAFSDGVAGHLIEAQSSKLQQTIRNQL